MRLVFVLLFFFAPTLLQEPNATPAVRQSAGGKQVGDSSTMAQAAKDANSHQPADSKETGCMETVPMQLYHTIPTIVTIAFQLVYSLMKMNLSYRCI